MTLKAIGNTLKSPMQKKFTNRIRKPIIKTLGNTIKNPMSMLHQNKNTIKNFVSGLQGKQFQTKHNFRSKYVRYLGTVTVKNFNYMKPYTAGGCKQLVGTKGTQTKSVAQMKGKELRSMVMRSSEQMRGKGIRSLVNIVFKSKPQLPLFFVAGGINRLVELNLLGGNDVDLSDKSISGIKKVGQNYYTQKNNEELADFISFLSNKPTAKDLKAMKQQQKLEEKIKAAEAEKERISQEDKLKEQIAQNKRALKEKIKMNKVQKKRKEYAEKRTLNNELLLDGQNPVQLEKLVTKYKGGVIFYDEYCKLCLTFKEVFDFFDSGNVVKWIGLNETEFSGNLDTLKKIKKEMTSVIHITNYEANYPDEIISSIKSDAVINVVSKLGFPYYLVKTLKLIPRRLRNKLYDKIQCNRYKWFGKVKKGVKWKIPLGPHINMLLKRRGWEIPIGPHINRLLRRKSKDEKKE